MTLSREIPLNELRETWLILLVHDETDDPDSNTTTDASPVQSWEFGVGNASTLHRVEAAVTASETTETDLLRSLMAELAPYRYDETVVITPARATVRTLRRRLIASGVDQPSLRGFTHVSLADQLASYTGQSLADYGLDQASLSPPRVTEGDKEEVVTTGSARTVWECWQQLFRLLPASEAQGTEL